LGKKGEVYVKIRLYKKKEKTKEKDKRGETNS